MYQEQDLSYYHNQSVVLWRKMCLTKSGSRFIDSSAGFMSNCRVVKLLLKARENSNLAT